MATAVLTPALLTARRAGSTRGEFFPWIALAPLVFLPLVGQSAYRVDLLLLLMEGIFLYLGARAPVWLLAALMVPELTIPNYTFEVGGVAISNRLVLSIAIFAIIQPHLFSNDWLTARGGKLLFIATLFFIITGLANALAVDASYAFKFARFLSTGVLAMLLVPAALRTEGDVRNLAIVCVIIGFASAGIAIMQHFGSMFPVPLIQSVPHAETPTDFGDWGGRALGLTESPIYLSSSMLLLILPLAGVVLISKQRLGVRLALLLVLFFLVMAVYYSYTRSWTYAAAAGTVPFLILYRGHYLKHLWFGLLIGVVVFFMWTGYQGNRYTLGANEDSSASGRYVLWEIGLRVALDNPVLGVGHNVFTTVAPEYADQIDIETLERQNAADVIGVYEPHNDFLNVWLSFGSVALLLYIALFYASGRNFIIAFNASGSPLIKGLALGSAGALIAYAVNSSFHNLLDSTLTLWLLAGLSTALASIATTEHSRVQMVGHDPEPKVSPGPAPTTAAIPAISDTAATSTPARSSRPAPPAKGEAVRTLPAAREPSVVPGLSVLVRPLRRLVAETGSRVAILASMGQSVVARLPGRAAADGLIDDGSRLSTGATHRHASEGMSRGMAGMALFIASEIMLFGGMFAAYFFVRNQADSWPPADIEHTVSKGVGAILTVVLISSSVAAHYGILGIKRNNRTQFKIGIMLALILGGVFIGGQIYEWLNLLDEGLTAGSGTYGATFYLITGFHGSHVIVGLALLSVVLLRAIWNDFTPTRHLLADAAVLYWHFVDVIWVFVFLILYLSY